MRLDDIRKPGGLDAFAKEAKKAEVSDKVLNKMRAGDRLSGGTKIIRASKKIKMPEEVRSGRKAAGNDDAYFTSDLTGNTYPKPTTAEGWEKLADRDEAEAKKRSAAEAKIRYADRMRAQGVRPITAEMTTPALAKSRPVSDAEYQSKMAQVESERPMEEVIKNALTLPAFRSDFNKENTRTGWLADLAKLGDRLTTTASEYGGPVSGHATGAAFGMAQSVPRAIGDLAKRSPMTAEDNVNLVGVVGSPMIDPIANAVFSLLGKGAGALHGAGSKLFKRGAKVPVGEAENVTSKILSRDRPEQLPWDVPQVKPTATDIKKAKFIEDVNRVHELHPGDDPGTKKLRDILIGDLRKEFNAKPKAKPPIKPAQTAKATDTIKAPARRNKRTGNPTNTVLGADGKVYETPNPSYVPPTADTPIKAKFHEDVNASKPHTPEGYAKLKESADIAQKVLDDDYADPQVKGWAQEVVDRFNKQPKPAEVGNFPSPDQVKAGKATDPIKAASGPTRSWKAGMNSASIQFADKTHQELYDYAAAKSQLLKDRGLAKESTVMANRRARVADMESRYSHEELSRAYDIYDDVKAQMKGVEDGEHRVVVDNTRKAQGGSDKIKAGKATDPINAKVTVGLSAEDQIGAKPTVIARGDRRIVRPSGRASVNGDVTVAPYPTPNGNGREWRATLDDGTVIAVGSKADALKSAKSWAQRQTDNRAKQWMANNAPRQGGSPGSFDAPNTTKEYRSSRGPKMSGRRRGIGGFLDVADFAETASDLKSLGIKTKAQAHAWLKENGITDLRGWNEMIEQNFGGKVAGAAARASVPKDGESRGNPIIREIEGLGKAGQATADLSGSRQIKRLKAAHPIKGAIHDVGSLKAITNHEVVKDLHKSINEGVTSVDPIKSKVYKKIQWDIDAENEIMPGSKIIDSIPVVKQIHGAASRNFDYKVNGFRKIVADTWLDAHPNMSAADADRLGHAINMLSGKGFASTGGDAERVLAASFFSPKNFASHIRAPFAAAKDITTDLAAMARGQRKTLSPASQIYIRSYGKSVASGLSVALLAKASGAEVNLTNPDEPDFGVIKIGNRRFDIWGGDRTAWTPIVKFAYNAAKNWTGKPEYYKSGPNKGKQKESTYPMYQAGQDIFNLFRYKASPNVNLLMSLATKEDAVGQSLGKSPKEVLARTAIKHVTPLSVQDALEYGKDEDVAIRALAFLLNLTGGTTSSYRKDDKVGSRSSIKN